jgi:putative colanic acid biosynthesis acetyltransferase WcaF
MPESLRKPAAVVSHNLAGFTGVGYDRGRSLPWQVTWFAVQHLVFKAWWFPARLRPGLLRLFGADVGQGVRIRIGVRVHWPWKLRIGDSSWIGEDVWILNLEPIDIGHDVCVSQGAFLCAGSHRHDSPTFEFDNGPIRIGDSAWIAAQALVLRGVTVGEGAVVGARALVARDVPPGGRVFAQS